MTDTNTPTPTKAPTTLSLLQKRDKLVAAWEELAPESKFFNMSLAQFLEATAPSFETRQALAASRARISSLVSIRLVQEKALNSVLKRTVNAVRCDANHGENSQLYRAMGYVPANERKLPGARLAVGSDEPSAVRSYPTLWERYQAILAAWEKADGVTLAGFTIGELRAAGTAMEQIRNRVLQAQAHNASLVGLKRHHDETTAALIRKIVASVICDPEHGENSALYRAMGYVPRNERKRPIRRPVEAPLTA